MQYNFNFWGTFIFDEADNVYLSETWENLPFLTIGNQIIPQIGDVSTFITKFNLQTDKRQ